MGETGAVTRTVEVPGTETLASAAAIVSAHLPATPVVAAPELGPGVVLKLEMFLPTGSFKVRGGLAAVAAAERRHPGAALVTASAGNHGLGVAYAADRLGAKATVVVAETASEAKVRALATYGVTLVRHGTSYDEAEARALEIAEEEHGHFISPYNDADVIAGQATVGTELLGQVPGVRQVVVPVGGGGLLSGIGLATAGSVHLVGVESAASTAMAAAVAAGEVVPVPVGPTMADGLAGNIEPGSVTVSLARRFASAFVAVTEEEIAEAVRHLAFGHGIVAEGSGAAGVAALQAGRVSTDDGPTVVVVTGRNIAPGLLVSVLDG